MDKFISQEVVASLFDYFYNIAKEKNLDSANLILTMKQSFLELPAIEVEGQLTNRNFKPIVYSSVKKEGLSEAEAKIYDAMFAMMVAAKQQILLRKALHSETLK